MAFEAPIALKRLVMHSPEAEEKHFAFTPLVWGETPEETAQMQGAIGAALTQTYEQTNFFTLTMGAPVYLWANEELLEDLSVLKEVDNLQGLFLPSAMLTHTKWAQYSMTLRAAGLTVVLVDRQYLGEHTAESSQTNWVSVSAREQHVTTQVEAMRERGFRVLVTDAPRSFLEGNVALGDAYLGPVHYSRETNRQPLAPGEAQCLEALRLLGTADADLAEVSAVLSLDPEMVIRVLHMANSAAIGAFQRIDSLPHAIVYLGGQRISSLVMASMISARQSDKQAMWFVLTRAAVCKALADGMESAYTAGLLSALAEDVGEAPEAMAIRAGVSFEVSLALSSGAGDLGAVVEAVRAYERGDIEAVLRNGWDPVAIAETYFDALPSTFEFMKLLYGDSAIH